MDSNLQINELRLIHQEYNHYFKSMKLVTNGVDNHLLVEIDGKNYAIMVDIAGWYTKEIKRHCPTFESLMMIISPNFNTKFNLELASKLQQLNSE